MMKFRVVIQRVDEAVIRVSNLIKNCGGNVYDVREADIVETKTGTKMGETYILCCTAGEKDFEYIKEKYYTTEIIYEGFKTLM